jgi:SAM-dependent methyltransferase
MEVWVVGAAYEAYVGRWSRRVAEVLVPWADVEPGRRWLDVGCVTGALTGAVLSLAGLDRCVGVDRSEAFLALAHERIADAVEPSDVPTVFADIDDYWRPFLGGQGPAPGYVAALMPAERDTLRETLQATLPVMPDGSIPLTARAWVVRGRRKRTMT